MLHECPAKPEQVRCALSGSEGGEKARSIKIYQECLPSRHQDVCRMKIRMQAARIMKRTSRFARCHQRIRQARIARLQQLVQRHAIHPRRRYRAPKCRPVLRPHDTKRSRAGHAPRMQRSMHAEFPQRTVHEQEAVAQHPSGQAPAPEGTQHPMAFAARKTVDLPASLRPKRHTTFPAKQRRRNLRGMVGRHEGMRARFRHCGVGHRQLRQLGQACRLAGEWATAAARTARASAQPCAPRPTRP